MRMLVEILVLVGGGYTLLHHLAANRRGSKAGDVRVDCNGGAVAVGGDVTVGNASIRLEGATVVLPLTVLIRDPRTGEIVAALPEPVLAYRQEASR